MTRSEIFEVVKTQIYQIVSHLRGNELHETDNLTDLGADSLDIVEVVSGSTTVSACSVHGFKR